MIVLMDYLGHCESVGVQCRLDWRPRDVNVEADQLTNEIFDSFDLRNRIEFDWKAIDLPMVSLLMKFSEGFSKRRLPQPPAKDHGDGAKFQKSVWG